MEKKVKPKASIKCSTEKNSLKISQNSPEKNSNLFL